MSIQVGCPQCRQTTKVKDQFAGKRVQCPHCQAAMQVPPLAARDDSDAPQPAASGVREQILGGFQGRIELPPVSLAQRLGTWLVLAVLLLMVVFYLAVLGGLAWLVYWLATSDFGPHVPGSLVSIGMAAAALALLCLLRPAFMPSEKARETYALPADQQALLHGLVARVCEQVDAASPRTIETECGPRLAANGRGGTLTIGLALVAGLSVEQLAGLVAGHMAQHRGRAGTGAKSLIRAINDWLWRSVYREDRFDRWVTRANLRPGFHAGRLLLPLRTFSLLARAVLWIPMFIGNTVAAGMVRSAELDADRCAARLVGAKTHAAALARLKIVHYAWEGILTELAFLYREQRLPDSLPHELAARLGEMNPELCATLLATVIVSEDIPFDSRPSDAERQAALTGEPASGVLNCPLPARTVLGDYPRLAREATWDYYSAAFGPQFLKAALRRVE